VFTAIFAEVCVDPWDPPSPPFLEPDPAQTRSAGQLRYPEPTFSSDPRVLGVRKTKSEVDWMLGVVGTGMGATLCVVGVEESNEF
jgi:hypothetical protein